MLEQIRSQGDGTRFRSFGALRLFLCRLDWDDRRYGDDLSQRKRDRYAEASCAHLMIEIMMNLVL